MATNYSRRARIRALNDEMRINGPGSAERDRWVLTAGVLGLGSHGVRKVIRRVASFDAFNEDNDPYGEHDFGSFEFEGDRLFWKIDYYNTTLDGGSPDPADPALTVRVLTIMLALEY